MKKFFLPLTWERVLVALVLHQFIIKAPQLLLPDITGNYDTFFLYAAVKLIVSSILALLWLIGSYAIAYVIACFVIPERHRPSEHAITVAENPAAPTGPRSYRVATENVLMAVVVGMIVPTVIAMAIMYAIYHLFGGSGEEAAALPVYIAPLIVAVLVIKQLVKPLLHHPQDEEQREDGQAQPRGDIRRDDQAAA